MTIGLRAAYRKIQRLRDLRARDKKEITNQRKRIARLETYIAILEASTYLKPKVNQWKILDTRRRCKLPVTKTFDVPTQTCDLLSNENPTQP